MDSYVARYRRDSEDWQAALAFGFIAALPLTMVAWGLAAVVANRLGDGLSEPERLTVIAVSALLVWPAASAVFLRWRRRLADPEGVLFRIDHAGVYLGTQQPEDQELLRWQDIAELQVADVESGESQPTRYLVVIRDPADPSGPRQEWQQGFRSGELDALRTVVARFAPDVPVTMTKLAS